LKTANVQIDRRWILVALPLLAALVMLLLHVRPLLVWHFTLRPQVDERGRQDRIQVSIETDLPAADAAWPRIAVGRMTLLAPLAVGQVERCGECDGSCLLILEEGQLAIIGGHLPNSYEVAVLQYAPSERDLSILRSSAANWRTVEALVSRGILPTTTLETFRYQSTSSRGIVARVVSESIERFVVYPYEPDGGPGHVFGISRTGPELARRIISSIAFGNPVESAHCEAGAQP